MKWLGILIVVILVGGSWALFSRAGDQIRALEKQVATLGETGDPDVMLPELASEIQSLEGQKTFNGILLSIFTAVFLGVIFAVFVLPGVVHQITQSVYDSGEEVAATPAHEARSLMAQGDYDGAIRAFREAARAEPLDRMPWVEIAKIERQRSGDPMAAIRTFETALEGREWPVDDEAFFLFRSAELYDEDAKDRETAVAILRRVIERFPETRHSVNARHKLREWNLT